MRLVLLLLAIAACKSRSESPPPASSSGTTVAEPAPAPKPVDPRSEAGALAPHLHASASGVLATWLEPAGETGHRLRFSRWSDGVWSPPVTIVEDTRIVANWADVPSVAEAGDGTLVAHWAVSSGSEAYAYDAVVARSIDGGATWSPLGPLHDDHTPTEHGFVSLVGEGDGVRAFWLDGRATADGGAMTLRSAVVTATIGADEVVDDRVCDCCGTAAAMTPDGALVAYRDRSADELRDIAVGRRRAAAWGSKLVSEDGWQIAGCPVNGPALAVDGRRAAVAWYTYAGSTHRVRVAFSDDGGDTFGAPIEVDGPRGSRSPLGRVSIVLLDDGTAIVGWLASDREDASVLVRRIGGDGRLGAELPLGANLAGRDAGFPRMAPTDGGVLVMWTESGASSRLRAVEVPVAAIPLPGLAGPVASAPARDPLIAVGSPAPPLEAVALDGAPASLPALRGQVVLLNLWATWCEPCRHELPVLAGLHESESSRGLAIVAINVDRKRTRDEIADYVTRRKLPFQVWLDPDDRASTALGASTFPINVLVGRDGTVVWRRAGAIRAEDPELRAALEAALAAP